MKQLVKRFIVLLLASAVSFALMEGSRNLRRPLSAHAFSQRTLNPRATNEAELPNDSTDETSVEAPTHLVATTSLYSENLDDKVKLDMIRLPSGTFMMGTSYSEADQVAREYATDMGDDVKYSQYGNERLAMQLPQHRVEVSGFFIAKFEVTQAQWRAVANSPKVKRDLISEPSYFKGENLPVTNIEWLDAIEFCERLARLTGKPYRLPSEAEWEYACRGGTSTQFHFGPTVTADLVNCNGQYAYGSAPKSVWRQKPTAVGTLGGANAFGLFDMHGNVAEWCLDQWHENYNGAPTDGSSWVSKVGSPWAGCAESFRVVRGGSFNDAPCFARSADRGRGWWINHKDYMTGFRVVRDAV